MTRIILFTTILTLSALLVPGIGLAEEPPLELNKAQLLIFKGDHLRRISQGQTVIYDFKRRSAGEPDKIDEVRMTVTRVRDDDLRDLSIEFLSGEDRLAFPPAQGYRGNPVAIQFLERDIRDMSRKTGGSIGYFRNRIRKAFNDPQIENTPVDIGDTKLEAVEIRVAPFKQDSNLAQHDGYTGKEYLFAFSEQVPGGLLSIRTRMSSEDGGSLEEELRYSRMIDAQ